MATPIQAQEPNNNNDSNNQEPKGRILSPEQQAEWGNDVNFTDPLVKDEAGNIVERDKQSDTTHEEEEEDDNSEDTREREEEPEELENLVSAEDPGDYTPADYSFEVTIFEGEEGKEKPKVVKVKSVEQAEELLEKDPNFGSAKNLLDFNRKVTRMENNLERDEREWKKQKDEYDTQVGSDQQRQEQITSIANEVNYLVSKGKLPEIDKKYATADWSDPEVAKQPGVKEQVALLSYMAKESAARVKAGLPPLKSALDAYNSWIIDETEQKKVAAKKEAAVQRKTNGARVAGGTPAPVNTAPKGIMVGRGGDLRDLTSGWGF